MESGNDVREPEEDILDIAVSMIADDDYNHIPESELRQRLAHIRGTHFETFLDERADEFLAFVRQTLRVPGDPEYGAKP